jgi:hypothetical protein
MGYAGGCKASVQAPGPCFGGRTAGGGVSEEIDSKFVGIVELVGESAPRAGASFDVRSPPHPAVYSIEKDHPCFQSWRGLLMKAAEERGTLVFGESAATGLIASLESGEKITGVVKSISHTTHQDAISFVLPPFLFPFVISRAEPELPTWVGILRKSKWEQVNIIFAYDAYHQRITSLALAEE